MSDTFAQLVVAALEEKALAVKLEIERLQTAILRNDAQGDPDLKKEHTYLLGHFNAYNKAMFYWEKGIRPTQTPGGDWLIPSGSQGLSLIHISVSAGRAVVLGGQRPQMRLGQRRITRGQPQIERVRRQRPCIVGSRKQRIAIRARA